LSSDFPEWVAVSPPLGNYCYFVAEKFLIITLKLIYKNLIQED